MQIQPKMLIKGRHSLAALLVVVLALMCAALLSPSQTAWAAGTSAQESAARAGVDVTLSMSTSTLQTDNAKVNAKTGFSDVSDSHWVFKEGWLTYVVQNGIMTGYADSNKFGPDDRVTRAQVVTVLYRCEFPKSKATTDEKSYAENKTRFTDNRSRQFYTAAMNWASDESIFTGDSGKSTVRPDDPITREELATVMYRYSLYRGEIPSANSASYRRAVDAGSVSSWASTGMSWCYTNKLMTGNATTNMLDPQGSATRAHMAKMITVYVRDVDSATPKRTNIRS